MATLTWGAPGTREYEIGVDRGVLFPDSTYGVAWTGLKTVTEKPSGGEAVSYYLDGQRYETDTSPTEFSATIEAFSAPAEFAKCDGTTRLSVGLSQTHQRRKPFGLCYRTWVGNDADPFASYKIHIIYNAIAQPSEREYSTLTDSADPLGLSWDIETVDPIFAGVRMPSHLVVSTKDYSPLVMSQIETILYGDDTSEPYLPTRDDVISILQAKRIGYGHGLYGHGPYGH